MLAFCTAFTCHNQVLLLIINNHHQVTVSSLSFANIIEEINSCILFLIGERTHVLSDVLICDQIGYLIGFLSSIRIGVWSCFHSLSVCFAGIFREILNISVSNGSIGDSIGSQFYPFLYLAFRILIFF